MFRYVQVVLNSNFSFFLISSFGSFYYISSSHFTKVLVSSQKNLNKFWGTIFNSLNHPKHYLIAVSRNNNKLL